MPTAKMRQYAGQGTLMPNYGWVQNTSNLSTVRDTVELVSAEGLNHNELMRRIFAYRTELGGIKKNWAWDARCRIKAICATGMAEIDREKQGYRLTPLGEELCGAPKSRVTRRNIRVLSTEEIEIFRKGLLTNPPVIRVLFILNERRRNGFDPMSKYDIGSRLGFVGDIGFTHLEPEFVVRSGKDFNNVEGTADKWARTIVSWLIQVGWVKEADPIVIYGKRLPRYTTEYEVDRVLSYAARSTVKYIPQEMLCSHRHPFAELVQQRRVSILKSLDQTGYMSTADIIAAVESDGIGIDEKTLAFEIINLQQAGIQIFKEGPYYRLVDRIKLDIPMERSISKHQAVDDVEKQIEHYVTLYCDSLPPRLIDNLIRYGYAGTKDSTLFESTVCSFFSFMGYEAEWLGQGRGKVADVTAKYRASVYPESYGLIIDAKAYSKYTFPTNHVRAMKEYIRHHGKEMLQDMIPKHAFAFVSMSFSTPDEKLSEIAKDTSVNGTAIDAYTLIELSAQVSKQQISIAELYPAFTTNKLFVCV